MVRIFFKGNLVPEWLEKVTPVDDNDPEYVKPVITFQRTVIVYKYKDTFILRRFTSIGSSAMIKISNGKNCKITGQSKNGVVFIDKPILTNYVITVILLIAMCVYMHLNT